MDQQTIQILLVEDEETHVELVRRALDRAPHAKRTHLTVAGSLEEARACQAESAPDLIVADLVLPDGKGTDLLPAEDESSPVPVILMTSQGDEQVAVDAIKAGALDYIVKSPVTFTDMPRIVERALREWAHITEHKQAEKAVRRRAEELAALQATVLDITVHRDLPTLLEAIVERATRLLNAPTGGLYLCEPDREEVRCVVSYNTPRDYRGIVLEYGEGAAGTVAQTGEPVSIDDYGAWNGRAAIYEQEPAFRAVLAVPMVWQGRVTGVIDVVDYAPDRLFTAADLELLALFASHAAIAVENTRLYEKAQEEIIERKRLEQNSQERWLYLENVLAQAPDAIVTLDAQHSILEWNPGAEKLFGYLREEAIGRDLDELIAGADARMFQEAIAFTTQALGGEPVPPTETIRYRKDGTAVDVILAGSPILVEGELVGTVAVYTDITERKQAEEEIRALKEFNESIVQNMAEGIAVLDARGRFTFTNPAAATLLGYNPEELVGQHWTMIVSPDQRPIVQAADESSRHGQTDRYQVELLRKNGTRFPVLVSGSPRLDPNDGGFAGTLAVFSDISERAQAEEKLSRRAREMAALYETSLEITSQLDLATLLNAIVQRATALVGAPMGGLYLMQADGETLRLVVSHNLPGDHIGTKLHLGEGLSGRIAQSGEPMMVADYDRWEGRAGVYVDDTFRRVLGIPLKVGDQVIGVINVTDDEQTGPFEEEEIRLVSLFADQAAIAIQNARLFEAEALQRREAETLRAATQALTVTLDLQQVFERILTELRKVVPYDSASVQQLDGNRLEIIGGHGFPNLEDLLGVSFDLTTGDNPNRHVIQSQASYILDDAPAVYDEFKRSPHAEAGIRSWLGVPLLFGDRLIGMIALDKQETGFYTEEHARLATAFAAQAAIAIENARLFRAEHTAREQAEATAAQLRTRERHLMLLTDITRAALETPDLQTMLQTLADQLGKLLEANGCYITLWDKERQVARPAAAYGPMRDRYRSLSIEPGELTMTESALRAGKPIIVEDLFNSKYVSPRVPAHFPAQSLLVLPLIAGEEKLGAALIAYHEPHHFHPDEVARAEQTAGHIALAVAKAQSLETEREQRELAEALRRAAIAITSTLNLDQILDQILEQVDRVVPNDAVNVSLVEGDRSRIVRWLGYERFGSEIHSVSLSLADTPSLRHMHDTGEALVIGDTAEYPGWVEVSEVDWIRSYAGAPIRVRDQVIGFLSADSATPGFFSPSHAEHLQAFAAQAGLAIGNAWLFHNVEQGKRDWEVTFDAMQDAVALVDRDQRIVRANKAFSDLVQKGFQRIIGQVYDTMLDGMTCPEATCPLGQVGKSRKPKTCTHAYRGRVFEVQATPILEEPVAEQESFTPTIYVMRDITDRQQAEDEIRRRNRELALLNRVIGASAVSQEIEPILETICRELATALDIPHSAAALLDERKTELTVMAEYQAEDQPSLLGTAIQLPKDIRERYLALKTPLVVEDVQVDPRLVPIHHLVHGHGKITMLLLPFLSEGEVVGHLALSTVAPRSFSAEEVDLAQRVAHQISGALTRARLAETQRQLSAAVEQAAEAVIITDIDGTIIYVNPAFERIVGYSRAEVIGQSPSILAARQVEIPYHQQLWRAVTAGQVWQERLEETRRDGSLYTLDLTATPVRNQAGDVVSVVATMRDVTREVQLEEQFRQAQKMEALGRLAGGIAHDFNNLLTVIHLSTRLLQRQLHAQDPLWEHVQRIQETGERAAKLTKQLLSFSRREVVEPEVLNLSQVVKDLNRMLQRIIGEDIAMRMVLADDLWLLKVDPSQLDQVLMNLVVNARDAMPDGGVLTIETSNVTLDEAYASRHVDAQPGDHVMLVIGDTGVGIDEETRSHLFEPFFTTKERGEGTGLGLSTVFGIVRQSGGHIRVESQLGQGTTFRIYLPRAKGVEAHVPSPAYPPFALDLAHGTETVLVVEDETAVRDLAVNVLKSCGYQVLAAKSGPEALQISEEHDGTIHVLLTDIVMPQMNGKELAERLQTRKPGLRVLYISGYADKEITQEGILAPDTVFLPKPFTIEDLTQKVRAILDDPGVTGST